MHTLNFLLAGGSQGLTLESLTLESAAAFRDRAHAAALWFDLDVVLLKLLLVLVPLSELYAKNTNQSSHSAPWER